MTATFRKNYPSETTGVIYSDNVFTDILSQSGCVGIRIYNGMDDNGNLTNVLVGVDDNGDDLVEGKIYEYGNRCLPICAENNPLNT
jgi:hypothetical protein